MFAFLNNLSISPNGIQIADNLSLLYGLITNLTELENYRIRKVRVPVGFLHMPIANSHSLAHHIHNSSGDKLKLLLTFVGNRMEVAEPEIIEALDVAQQDLVIDVTLNGDSSQLLTEAHIMQCPSLSINTAAIYCQDILNCSLNTLTQGGSILSENIQISNIHNAQSITSHQAFLSDWKKKIVYAKTQWDPQSKPVWNDHTPIALQRVKFPMSVSGGKDKKAELIEVGTIVAELNGWQYDERVSKLNKNAGQMRHIFRSKSGVKDCYLSVDFEKPYGFFELHDYKGKHLGEIKFIDGSPSGGADSQGHHNIKV